MWPWRMKSCHLKKAALYSTIFSCHSLYVQAFNWSQSTHKTCCHVRCLIVTRIKVTWLIWISYVIFSFSSTTNETGIVSYLYEGQYQNTIQKLKLDRVFKVKDFKSFITRTQQIQYRWNKCMYKSYPWACEVNVFNVYLILRWAGA